MRVCCASSPLQTQLLVDDPLARRMLVDEHHPLLVLGDPVERADASQQAETGARPRRVHSARELRRGRRQGSLAGRAKRAPGRGGPSPTRVSGHPPGGPVGGR